MATVIVPTLDPLVLTPYSDEDVARYGESPASKELEIRVAASPVGSGALVVRRQSVNQIAQSERVGRQQDALQTTTGWSPAANVAVATYNATNPTGYSGNSLEIQATGGSSTDRGASKTIAALDLSQYGGGTLFRVHVRCTSVTNLVAWNIRAYFTTMFGANFATWTLHPAASPINTWAEVLFAKGNPTGTGGTVDWSQFVGWYVFADVSAAYTGNLELRDMRIGQTQTAKTVPDGHLVAESTYDLRARYRDDATAKTSSTLAALMTAGATNVRYTGGTWAVGDDLTVVTAGLVETRTITVVGTSGAGGTGITVSEAFTHAHASGDVIEARYWGPWSPWATAKVSLPPVVAAVSPADGASLTDPTPALVHSFTSPGGKAQVSRTTRIYARSGYANALMARDPLAYYRLNDASGAIADASGNAHPSTSTTGTPDYAQAGLLTGDPDDDAIQYIGAERHNVPNHADFRPAGSFSLLMLARWTALPAGVADLARLDDTVQDEVYGFKVDGTTPQFRFRVHVGAGVYHQVVGGVPATGTLFMLAGVFAPAGDRLSLHVNGEEVQTIYTASGSVSYASVGEFQVGSSSGTVTVDEVVLLPRSLDPIEVAKLWSAISEAPGDALIREDSTLGTSTTTDVPRFLLDEYGAYAWEVQAYDTDALSGTSTRRSFNLVVGAVDAIASLAATADTSTGAVTLTWAASAEAELDHYRVYWRDASGVWVRIDGGPSFVDDSATPLTALTFTHYGARLGVNEYAVTAHLGSGPGGRGEGDIDAATVEVTLSTEGVGRWVLAVPGDQAHTFEARVIAAPADQGSITEAFDVPGRGETVHLTWGRARRRVSLDLFYRPVVDGDWHRLLEEMKDSASRVYVKWPAGWMRDPWYCVLTDVGDVLEVGGMMRCRATFEATAT